VLCLMGGAMGIVLGRGASLMVRVLLSWPTELSLEANRGGGGGVGHGRGGVRLLPGVEGVAARPDRGAAL